VAATAAGVELTNAQRADLERYLDVSRAELLFCRAALLVEGASEKYLLPALARALGFDLDAYGVIVADVSGTDFAPYRSLLTEDGLGVPHVIITDGDPISHASGKYVYAGLKRAARLLPDDEAPGIPLWMHIDGLLQQDGRADANEARLLAADGDIFVGEQTLEVDLVPLPGTQMTQAHAELGASERQVTRFAEAIAAIAGGSTDTAIRKDLLRWITEIGKGRFAQRLAALIDAMDPADLRSAIIASRTAGVNAALPSAMEIAELMAAGSYGYLLAALDRISREIRGRALIGTRQRCTVRRRAGQP
jgi:putative ATP-dependent endonuclease of OLD family